MRPNIRNIPHLLAPLLVLTFLATSSVPIRAADPGDSKVENQKPRTESEPTFDLHFPGGPLPELISALEKAQGKNVNLMLPPEAGGVMVPKLSLTGVDTEAVLRSLNILLNQPKTVGQFGHTGNIWVYQMLPETKQSKVFFVGNLLSRFSIDDLTTAIETAWRLESNQPEGELKFHKETQLLFARATPGQLETMRSVIGELSKAATMPQNPEPGRTATTHPESGK